MIPIYGFVTITIYSLSIGFMVIACGENTNRETRMDTYLINI